MIWTILTLCAVAGVSTLVGIAIGRAIGPGDWPKGPLVRRPPGAGSEPETVDGLRGRLPGESFPDAVDRAWLSLTPEERMSAYRDEDGMLNVRSGPPLEEVIRERLPGAVASAAEWPSTPGSKFAPPRSLPERVGPPTPRVEIERPTEIERATEQLVRRRMAEQEAKRGAVDVHVIGDDEQARVERQGYADWSDPDR